MSNKRSAHFPRRALLLGNFPDPDPRILLSCAFFLYVIVDENDDDDYFFFSTDVLLQNDGVSVCQ